MPISEALQELILKQASVLDITSQATAEGMLSLHSAGLLKVANGDTSLEEVQGITHAP